MSQSRAGNTNEETLQRGSPQPQVSVRRRLIILVLVAAVMSLTLRFSAAVLVASSPRVEVDYVLIGEPFCAQCCQSAATRLSNGSVEGILLCTGEQRRLVLLGVTPTMEVLNREKLIRDGFAPERIEIIGEPTLSDWDRARRIDDWLQSHPAKNVLITCDRFNSRRWSYTCDRVIPESRRSRVMIEGVTDPRYNDFNWWRSRVGIKSYVISAFRLGYAFVRGEDPLEEIDWSADKYEANVLP